MSSYSLEISPSGIKKSPKKLADHLIGFLNDLSRVEYIVTSELRARVFDKALGIFWLLLETIIMAGLYYVLTVVIFKASVEENHFLFILVSVVFWRWFSKMVDNSPMAISGYGTVLKQTNFPVHLVILIFMGTETVLLGFGMLVLIVFLAFYGIYPTLAYVYLPVVLLTQFVFALSLVQIFSVIGTFLKDFASLVYAFTSIWWYMSPGIYPVSKIPQDYLWLYMLNPFAHILPAYRDILMYGKQPALLPLVIILSASIVLSVIGTWIVNKARYYLFVYL